MNKKQILEKRGDWNEVMFDITRRERKSSVFPGPGNLVMLGIHLAMRSPEWVQYWYTICRELNNRWPEEILPARLDPNILEEIMMRLPTETMEDSSD